MGLLPSLAARMKFSTDVSSSPRKSRFAAPSSVRRKLMSASLSKELRRQYGVRSLPIRKNDEVRLVRGKNTDSETTGQVTCVYRKRWYVNVDFLERSKCNKSAVPLNIHPSNLVITKIMMDKDREALLARKKNPKATLVAPEA